MTNHSNSGRRKSSQVGAGTVRLNHRRDDHSRHDRDHSTPSGGKRQHPLGGQCRRSAGHSAPKPSSGSGATQAWLGRKLSTPRGDGGGRNLPLRTVPVQVTAWVFHRHGAAEHPSIQDEDTEENR